MNIVILGAGHVGLHCAKVLSKEENNVILIDKDARQLEIASREIDVATRLGDGTDWQLLEELTELNPEIFLALTGSDETNLAACAIAKNLGYEQTIASVKHARFLNCSRIDFGRVFYVDHFVSPDLLTAEEIYQCIVSPGSIGSESFAHGSVQMRTFVVPKKWRKVDKKLMELSLPAGMMVGLISRDATGGGTGKGNASMKNMRCFFPHGEDSISHGDEVTIIGESDAIAGAHQFFGIIQKTVQSAVIIGGSLIGLQLAKILERRGISVRLIEKDFDKCSVLAERLANTTVLHHDGTDFGFLQSEKVGNADVFVACTGSDEVNLLAAILGKEAGCEYVVTVTSDTLYIPVLTRLGIRHAVSPRINAVNRILSITQRETVASMVSLYEGKAEVMEIRVSMDSRLAGIPISELGPQLPHDFLIAIIQNRGRIMVANGNRILSPGDTVIAITDPRHLKDLRQLF
ncbi:MAG: trk system potassium uptake protein TrkA [Chlamydiales bacterium]|jgi:trk system potassium uptake protein TrkA